MSKSEKTVMKTIDEPQHIEEAIQKPKTADYIIVISRFIHINPKKREL